LYLWSSANGTCTKVGTQTISDLGNGEYQLCVSGLTGAALGPTYVLSAKYDVKSLNGSLVGNSLPNCTYVFQTSFVSGSGNASGSAGSLLVTANCSAPAPITRIANVTTEAVVDGKPTVTAYPNPFNDNVRFVIQSPVSGQATLEVFNMVGQKLRTVYNGRVLAGAQQIVEFKVPATSRVNMIYMLRVNGQQVVGKLISVK
jgi:hypothetical protein